MKSFLVFLSFFVFPYSAEAELIWAANFDDQPDWQTSGTNDITIPQGWDGGRTDENWHPSTTPGSQPSLVISGDDPEKVQGGAGKSLISWSESYNDRSNNGFTSDGLLVKDLPASSTMYVEFDVKFQPGWAGASGQDGGQIKLFRILHWDGNPSRFSFHPPNSNSSPVYIFDWGQDGTYGMRQFHALRQDPQSNYFYWDPKPGDAIWNEGGVSDASNGDWTAYFGYNTRNFSPRIIDQTTGQELSDGRYDTHTHDQVFGSAWHRMKFYVALNSAPGVQDGILRVWMNDAPIWEAYQVPWIAADGDINRKWNSVIFGGNDRFHFEDADSETFAATKERWYAIDNIKIYDSMPNRPLPPSVNRAD